MQEGKEMNIPSTKDNFYIFAKTEKRSKTIVVPCVKFPH
jgi:hypothetical protein